MMHLQDYAVMAHTNQAARTTRKAVTMIYIHCGLWAFR